MLNNNDILIRIRYALDIKDIEMVAIFKLAGIDITIEEVQKMLKKESASNDSDQVDNKEEIKLCSNLLLESFLNGLIISKRGIQDSIDGESNRFPLAIINNGNVNNVMLKKLKIALELTSEDMLEIFDKAGIVVTKGELSAVLRKVGHRNYKECGDRYARNFLKGLTVKYRN